MVLSLNIGIVAAQYNPPIERTTEINIGTNGTFTASQSDMGIDYQIEGTAGATGFVTATRYNGNPQSTATLPAGIGISKFVVMITFEMDAEDFEMAKLTLSYTDFDVENLESPYAVYKYLNESDSYIELPTVINAAEKTVTFILTSTNDPLLAIGGVKTVENSQDMTWIALVAVVIVAVVIIALIMFIRMRNSSKPLSLS